MGIKSELHEAILKRGGKVPPYGGIAAAMDELNKLPVGGGGGSCIVTVVMGEDQASIASADKTFEELATAISGGVIPVLKMDVTGGLGRLYTVMNLAQCGAEHMMFTVFVEGVNYIVACMVDDTWVLDVVAPI